MMNTPTNYKTMQGITPIVSNFKTLIKYNFILVALLLLSYNVWGQTYILNDNFSTSTFSSSNITTTGASSTSGIPATTNWTNVTFAYQAGLENSTYNCLKLGKSGSGGSITSPSLNLSVNGGSFIVAVDCKQYSTTENLVTVTPTGITSQSVNVANTYPITSTSFYTAIFNFTGGTNNSTITISSGTGRSFIANVRVYTTYSLIYNGNTNTSGSVPVDLGSPYISGSNVTVLANTGSLVKSGYTFNGWNTAANGSGTSYSAGSAISNISANSILYAQWLANSNTITFDGNGATGGSTSPQTINTAASANLNANGFTRTGYTFSGWNTTANGTGTAYANQANYTMGTSSLTLYAQWTINSFTVTFDANGGSGNMANQTSSAAANLTSNSFTRTCYAFTGWNTAANGTGTAYADGASYPFTSSTTLYAQWSSQNQWTGSANNNWNNAGNWSCGHVPTATENVLINTGSPALDINYEVPTSYTLTLSGTGTLTINPGNKLTITGTANFGNKLVTVAADASNVAAIVLNGGSLQNATNVALQQWFTGQRAWRMLSNPFTTSITGSSIANNNTGFSVNQSGTGDMVVYNSGTDAWSANTTIAANTCYGFFFKGLQSDFNGTPGLSNYSGAGPTASVFSMKGTLNTGFVTVTPSNASPNYTLVGNPFAAPVNSITLTGGAAAPFYYYQANAASTDSKIKSGAWIVASSNSSNTTTIPIMGLIAYQAPSITSFTIPIAAINTANTPVSALFKTTASATQLNIDLMKNNTLFDRCIVREDIDALAQSLDQKDLLKMENVTANVYALTPANDRLAVYTEPAFTQAIPLAISAPVGTYQFNIQNTMNTSADWYLIDNYTHQQQLLANNSTYTFDITNDASSKGNKRFKLSKQAWTTSIGTASNQESFQLLGNVVQDHIALQVDATIHQASYQLVDLRGSVLAQGTLMAGKQEIAMASFINGMYMLYIQNDQQHSVYKITKY